MQCIAMTQKGARCANTCNARRLCGTHSRLPDVTYYYGLNKWNYECLYEGFSLLVLLLIPLPVVYWSWYAYPLTLLISLPFLETIIDHL